MDIAPAALQLTSVDVSARVLLRPLAATTLACACAATNGDNEVWTLAQDPEHYGAITSVMYLRETLRPYVMAINQIAADTGMPMLVRWNGRGGCRADGATVVPAPQPPQPVRRSTGSAPWCLSSRWMRAAPALTWRTR